jgi:hypothetical protein
MHVSAMKGIKYYFNLLTSVYQNKRKENIKEIKWSGLFSLHLFTTMSKISLRICLCHRVVTVLEFLVVLGFVYVCCDYLDYGLLLFVTFDY